MNPRPGNMWGVLSLCSRAFNRPAPAGPSRGYWHGQRNSIVVGILLLPEHLFVADIDRALAAPSQHRRNMRLQSSVRMDVARMGHSAGVVTHRCSTFFFYGHRNAHAFSLDVQGGKSFPAPSLFPQRHTPSPHETQIGFAIKAPRVPFAPAQKPNDLKLKVRSGKISVDRLNACLRRL